MKANRLRRLLLPLALLAAYAVSHQARAAVFVQCPGDTNGDARWTGSEIRPSLNTKCMHIVASDGFTVMPDGKQIYTFGFSDVTGTLPGSSGLDDRLDKGLLAAQQPAPTIELNQGDRFYLTLSNAGFIMRPDLFDPHSVHFHGFPNAAAIFDGTPEASIVINMGSSITYFYNIVEPGTFIWHCHVEATEHLQMGMIGQLFVKPAQDGSSRTFNGKTYTQFAYNDTDGSTGYNTAFPIQLNTFDHVFHEASLGVQPLPFAAITSTYSLFNGRGYPDTVNLVPPPSGDENPRAVVNGGTVATGQPLHARIVANAGDTLLLRLSNLSVVNLFTVTALGLPPMRVVGQGARILRGGGEVGGKDLYYETQSVTLGGGEATDVLIDTRAVTPGTYFLYTTNLNFLSNGAEDVGGMMTEIVIN